MQKKKKKKEKNKQNEGKKERSNLKHEIVFLILQTTPALPV